MTPGGIAATLDFARAVRDRSGQRATQVGLEHEFFVFRGSGQVDFRQLLPQLDPTGRRIDPGDRNAVRRPSGLAITCDGREAEFATPPVAVDTAVPAIESWARSGQREMRNLVPDDHALWGASTHISISVPDYKALRVARLFARTFAPALMLAMDGHDSPGLLLRPRPGRLELGGDYAYGIWLHAAAVLTIGGTLACVHAIDNGDDSILPPRVRVRLEPARERFGWYVDRSAFGPDLYTRSRSARLGMSSGGSITAQAHLHEAWCKARAALDRPIPPALDAALWRLIHGTEPLPSETRRSRAVKRFGPVQTSPRFGRALEWIERPGFATTAVSLTWNHAVFVLKGSRRGFACVPAHDLDAFYGALDAGELDDSVDAFLRSSPTGRVLARHADTKTVGLFDSMVAGSTLAPERDETGTPVPTSTTGTRERGTETQSRPGKHDQPPPFIDPKEETTNRWGDKWWWAAGAVVVILIAIGLIALSGDDETVVDVRPSAQPTTSIEPSPSPSLSTAITLDSFTSKIDPQTDGSGDYIYSIDGVAPQRPTPQTDIRTFGSGIVDLDQTMVDEIFNNSIFGCDDSTRRLVIACASEQPFPAGETVVTTMTLADDAGKEKKWRYVYASVFESNGVRADDYDPGPVFTWDFFQGTDRWYSLEMSGSRSELEVLDSLGSEKTSLARAVVQDRTIVFFIPASELPDPSGYRMSAFRHDGTFAPAASSGDVTGANPTQKLTRIGKKFRLGPGGGTPPPADVTDPISAIDAFIRAFNEAQSSGDVAFLMDALHPAVLDRYGNDQCRSTLTEAGAVELSMRHVTGPTVFTYETDGVSTSIPRAYTVSVTVTSSSGRSETETHFVVQRQKVLWFTDCGDPR